MNPTSGNHGDFGRRSVGRIGIGSVSSSFSGPVVVLLLVAAISGFLLLVR